MATRRWARALASAAGLACALAACGVPAPREGRAPTARAARAPATVVALSDIHFDPFYDPALFKELLGSPAEAWRGIFERSAQRSLGAFIRETDYTLWRSTLAAIAAAAPEPDAIVVSGDFLAHRFGKRFRELSGGDGDALPGFIDKTIALIADDMRRAFPRAQILPAIGNNDAPCGNYMSEPGSAFLAAFARAFGDATGAGARELQQLSTTGYYSAPMRFDPRLRVVVLNASYWSVEYKNPCGKTGDHAPGADEMAWFGAELDGIAARGERAWVMSHIPPGIDLFATEQKNKKLCGGPYTMMYAPAWNAQYLALLEGHGGSIELALHGHTHNHELHVVGAGGPHPIPNVTLPAISTIYKNNPAFAVLRVDRETRGAKDMTLLAMAYPKAGGAPTPFKVVYDFDATFGTRDVSGASALGLVKVMNERPEVRDRYIANFTGGSGVPNLVFEDWRGYACSMTGLDVASFERCYCR